jgi:hypothetical protein
VAVTLNKQVLYVNIQGVSRFFARFFTLVGNEISRIFKDGKRCLLITFVQRAICLKKLVAKILILLWSPLVNKCLVVILL